MTKIKVVIFDQSPQFLKDIKLMLTNPFIEQLVTYTDLQEGLQRIQRDKPDVLLLDVNFPKQENKLALEIILDRHSIPIILISGNTIFEMTKTVQAMNKGAVDYLKLTTKEKPELANYKDKLLEKIIQASNKRSSHRNLQQTAEKLIRTSIVQEKTIERKTFTGDTLVVIGTSTGGPRALQKVLQQLPEQFQAPILVVQHMPEKFTKSLANRLNQISKLNVKEAKHGEQIIKGSVYIAPGNYHMQVKQAGRMLKINLTTDAERLGHRPSVNTLFDSIAQIKSYNKIAVVLTGMGKDGAEGVRQIKQNDKDAIIIAESKESAIINGMPNAVINTHCVTETLHLDHIAEALLDYIAK